MIAAVSGGSDSVALLFVLDELQRRGELALDAVAHLNHGIRGSASDADEAFCRAVAARLRRPFVAGRVDVPAAAARDGVSLEVAARRARLRFLGDALRARGADGVATGHTCDDQAETVLLRLVRGSGLRGTGAMAPRRGHLIRPVLGCSREELRHHLVELGEPWREDETNADLSNPRNHLRHVVLPAVARDLNPSVRASLARFADLAREDDSALESQAASAAARLVEMEGPTVTIERTALVALPPALARRVVRRALEAAGLTPTLGAVDAVRSVAAGDHRRAQLRGLLVEPSGRYVVLVPCGSLGRGRTPETGSPAFSLALQVPGAVSAPDADWMLEASGPFACRGERFIAQHQGSEAAVDAAAVGTRLVVRNRRPGDRMRPVGMAGRKKVQDLFVDRKVRRAERDRVPIVTDRRDRIIWVAGHASAEEFRVTERTNAVVILKLRRFAPSPEHVDS